MDLFSSSSVIMLLIDIQEGVVISANPAALAFYGYTQEQFKDMKLQDLDMDSPTGLQANFKKASTEKKAIFHVRHRLANGDVRHMEIYTSFVLLEEKPCIFSVLHDETEKVLGELALRREKAKAEQASQAKNHFLANISHELRTPLHGLLGMLEILDNMNLPGAEKFYLDLAKASGYHLMDIIQDILEFSKIEQQRLVFSQEPTDLYHLAKIARELMEPQAKKKGLELVLEPKKGNFYAFSDHTRISQIIINLLNNGIKYTDRGQVLLRMEKRSQEWILEVKDDGIGIPPAKIQEIFSPFHQLENPFSKKHGGLGLGLAIVYQIVTQMKGQLEVESQPGYGSLFRVILPIKWNPGFQEKAISKNGEEDMEKAEKGPGTNAKILVVEDEAINTLYIKSILETEGFEIYLAAGGLEAVGTAQVCRPDLILMDVGLPDITGLEATAKIRSEDWGESVPIIALTAHAHPADQKAFLEGGMNAVITKPFQKASLLRIIKKHLHLRNEANEGP